MNKSVRIITALLAALFLSGCAVQDSPVSVLESVQTAEHSGQSTSEKLTEPESTVSDDSPDDTSSTSASVQTTAEDTEPQEITEPASSEDSEPQISDSEPEVTTATSATTTLTSQTTQTTQTEATTSATTAPPDDPPEIVIPEILTPLSPGTAQVSNEKAVFDYSNASEGYVSVKWSGTGKRVKLRLTCGGVKYDHDVSEGGVTEYFPLSCGAGTYTAQLYEQTEGTKYSKSLEQEFYADIRSETTPFLYPNKYVMFDSGSASVAKAAAVCAGKSGDIEKIAAIFQWVTDNITYDKQLAETVKSGYVPDPDRALSKGSGICYDYASLMAAMTRSQGIPTRLVIGYASKDIYHAWNEVWTDETGWITPELLLSQKGYNIVDATFYAGSADKASIAGYISDSGNYASLYYY